MIEIGTEICANFESSSKREWLETNGIGGYASSSISGANTRRYHALLVAATRPPLGRLALLSKFEETLTVAGERFDLSSNQYGGSVFPDGFKYLKSFRLDPFPIWRYEAAKYVRGPMEDKGPPQEERREARDKTAAGVSRPSSPAC